jgi:5-methylcytosine-specific restriction endonuclease McrA
LREERIAYRNAHREELKARGQAYYRANSGKWKAAYQANIDTRRAARATRYSADAEAARERARAYYAANRERILAAKAEERHADPEPGRARSRDYYTSNTEQAQARARAWKQANPGKVYAVRKAWYAANPEKAREMVARETAKRKSAPTCDHPACLILGPYQLAWQTNPHRCYICDVPVFMGKGGNLHMDHVIPIARGGIHCAENLRPACDPCNRRKWANPL